MPATLDKQKRPTHYGFSCGYIQEVGEHVTISLEANGYHVKRSLRHPCGKAWDIIPRIKDARKHANKLSKENI